MSDVTLNTFSFISLSVLIIVYFFLITEKVNKVLVSVLGGVSLILMQVFKTATHTSQESALEFIDKNLDILGFVVGMMILVGLVRKSGLFEALAIWLVKIIRGNPTLLLIVISYLTLFMTALLSNIPTVLIMTPIVFILIKELKLPMLPYVMAVVTMANLGGAATPISDPTTYYQAKTVGLSFMEVVQNSGVVVLILSVISIVYIRLVFFRTFSQIQYDPEDVASFEPLKALQDKKVLFFGTPILLICILLMVFKEQISKNLGITLDNAGITIAGAFLAMLLFHQEPRKIFSRIIDWEIIFFFMGLFVVVGSLEFTHVIEVLAGYLVHISGGSTQVLLGLITVGSAVISTFIDNVPYNITMVSAVKSMAESGVVVYPLWWGLNLGTSIGGAGSPIAAACNVIIFGQAEKEKIHILFFKYLLYAFPLVLINSVVAYFVLIWKYF